MIRTLGMSNLKGRDVEVSVVRRGHITREMQPEGDLTAIVLLTAHALLFSLNFYMILPELFVFSNELGYSPTLAGLLIGVTPLATALFAAFYNGWVNRGYKGPLLFGSVMIFLSNVAYVYAYSERSLYLLLASRFIFGIGGTKVIHRRYIANYILRSSWEKYYSKLTAISFVGMIIGPLLYLGVLLYKRLDQSIDVPETFLLPGYMNSVIWACFTIAFFIFFQDPRKYERRRGINRAFGNKVDGDESSNTTSNYSLASKQSKEKTGESQSAEHEHYN